MANGGYGVDVLALPDQQFDVFYFYDDLGLARWSVGSAPYTANSTLQMLQTTGFCPTCAYTPISMQPLGTMSMNFTSAQQSQLQTHFVLNPPLSGEWNVSESLGQLAAGQPCTH